MPNVVDTLVTRMMLDSGDYQKGADAVLSGTSKISDGLGRIHSGIGSVLSRFKELATAGLAVGAGLIGAAVAGGTYAVKAAIGFDTIERSLQAVTKSAERAKQILAFDDKLAGPSIFSSEELAQASLSLEAFKLTTERFLPVAEKLGTIFGGNADALKQYVDALGYIKNGRFGEGFESLSRAGLSRQDFEAQGLQFDKGGAFVGSADQALDAIERLVNDRFGKLSQEMANGPAAKLASVMDAVGRAARVAGGAILSFLVPAFDKVGNYVSYLVDSGALQKIADGFAKMFDGDKIGDAFISALSYVVAVMQNLPKTVASAIKGFNDGFNSARKTIIELASIMAGLFVGEAIIKGILAFIEAYKVLTSVIKGAAIAQATLTALTGAGVAVVLGSIAAMALTAKALDSAIPVAGKTEISVPKNTIMEDAKKNKDAFDAWVKTQKDDKSKTDNKSTPTATPSTQLDQIANNTKRTAIATEKQADIQTQLSGGSTLAKDVTSEYGRYQTFRGHTDIHRKLAELGDMIVAIVGSQDVLNQRARMA